MVAIEPLKPVRKGRLIVVTGATGRQGGAVARHLLDQGFQVRALTRHPDQGAAHELDRLGAQIVRGDMSDRHSLDQACQGAYGVFSVQDWRDGCQEEVRQGVAVADAAQAAGAQHLVYSSVAAANRNTGLPHFESKAQIEEYLRKLDIPVTVFRPVFFMENWGISVREAILGGSLPQPLHPYRTLQQIAVTDIGAFVAKAFAEPEAWTGREFELAGDELTMNEVASAFTRALGRPVLYVQVPWEAFRGQVGAEITHMYEWFERFGYNVNIAAVRAAHPRLLRLDDYLRTQSWVQEAAAANIQHATPIGA